MKSLFFLFSVWEDEGWKEGNRKGGGGILGEEEKTQQPKAAEEKTMAWTESLFPATVRVQFHRLIPVLWFLG